MVSPRFALMPSAAEILGRVLGAEPFDEEALLPRLVVVTTTLHGIVIKARRTPQGWELLSSSEPVDAVWLAGAREHLDLAVRLVEDNQRRAPFAGTVPR